MEERVTRFGHPLDSCRNLADDEFLKSIVWEPGVSAEIMGAARDGDIARFASAMQKHRFSSARTAGSKRALLGDSKQTQSLWSRHAFQEASRTAQLAEIWKVAGGRPKRVAAKMAPKRNGSGNRGARPRKPSRQVELILKWFEQNSGKSSLTPVERLILFEILHESAGEWSTADFFQIWRLALSAAIELSTGAGSEEFDSPVVTADQKLLAQGELPWQAGLLFADVKGAGRFGRTGRRFLQKQLEAETDTDGTPQAALLDRFSLWLAPLVRATRWGRWYKTQLWTKAQSERLALLLKVAASFCRSDGRFALGNGLSSDVVPLLTSASRLVGLREKSAAMKYLRAVDNGSSKARSAKPTATRAGAPENFPVTQSDWARLACLRNNWSIDADTLLVAHHREKPMIELTVLGKPLLSGVWDVRVAIDGKPFEFSDDWTCACWFSDGDADFMELHISVGRRLKIDRQILLSRKDHFAMLADVVVAKKGEHIDYAAQLPLCDDVQADTCAETREMNLKIGRMTARVFPLALPADNVHSAAGSLGTEEGRIELKQAGVGALYAPLVIDWAPERRRRHAQWRTLSVAENGRMVKSSAASGHRLRIGDHQLLIYRSLKNTEQTRTVLGHHTACETVVGHFDAQGDLEPILIVE